MSDCRVSREEEFVEVEFLEEEVEVLGEECALRDGQES